MDGDKDEPLREEEVTRGDKLDDRVEEGAELPDDDGDDDAKE